MKANSIDKLRERVEKIKSGLGALSDQLSPEEGILEERRRRFFAALSDEELDQLRDIKCCLECLSPEERHFDCLSVEDRTLLEDFQQRYKEAMMERELNHEP